MTTITKNSMSSKSNVYNKIKVILIDDSKVVQSIFERVLISSGQIEIVACANSASDALEVMKTVTADIILLDIEMPNRSGLDALPDIISKAKNAKVIIVSSFIDSNGPAAIKALSLGACDTLAKPGRNGLRGDFSKTLINKVVRLGRKASHYTVIKDNISIKIPLITKPEAILIGASTGGIPSIQEFLENLSDVVSTPIFIAQHLPDAFINYFARQLTLMGNRKVVSVYDRHKVEDNTIYLAPGNGHMVVEKLENINYVSRIEYYEHSSFTPSVDALFHSAAKAYASKALAIIMSGMGRDGALGAEKLFNRDSQIWTQSKDTSVVWGMPGSVVKDGNSHAELSPKNMAGSINRVFVK